MSTKQSRKTARRKARQQSAVAALKSIAPGFRIPTRFGGALELEVGALSQVGKQRLVEGYERWRRGLA